MSEDRFEKFIKVLLKSNYKPKNKTIHMQESVKKNLNSVNTQEIEHELDSAIDYLADTFAHRDELDFGWKFTDEQGEAVINSSAFRDTVRAYYEIHINDIPEFEDEPCALRAWHKTIYLFHRLDPSVQITSTEIKKKESHDRKGAIQEAIDCLYKAAKLLDQPDGYPREFNVYYPDSKHSPIEHLNNPPYGVNDFFKKQPPHPDPQVHHIWGGLKLPADLGDPGDMLMIKKYHLLPASIERIAEQLEDLVAYTGVRMRYEDIGYDADNVGKRGAASNPESATRGLFIHELDKLVPDIVNNRFAVIAKLATLASYKKINPHLVRSILMRGHT